MALCGALVAACVVAVVAVNGGTATVTASPLPVAETDPSSSDRTAGDATLYPTGSPWAWTVPVAVETPLYGWTATPTPAPTKAPFQMDMYQSGTFVSQMDKHSCTAGAAQNMLNLIGPTVDTTDQRQRQISNLLILSTTSTDSHNGGYGPEGWAITMTTLSGHKYKLVIDPSLDAAMRDAALALRRTNLPVGLLAWRGAHSWVMTGFKSDADPLLFPTSFEVQGAYIVDAYYPRFSNIWGQTLKPDSYRDMKAMAYNYRYWHRPEGKYPGRDGKWLLVVPVEE